jgi:hypothetical protein
MSAARSLGKLTVISIAFVALGCDDDGDETRASPLIRGPEPMDDDTSRPSVPGILPLSPDTSAASTLPKLSCGGLLASSTCDPVTAWPCNTEVGETCEYSNSAGAFRCYLLPTAVAFCGACDRVTTFCGRGLTCVDRCEKYCCADTDCEQGRCAPTFENQLDLAPIGLCVDLGVAVCGPDPGDVPPPSLEPADAGSPRASATPPDGG